MNRNSLSKALSDVWKKRAEFAEREYYQWDEARKKRIQQYKVLWNHIHAKEKRLKELTAIEKGILKRVVNLYKSLGVDEKSLSKLGHRAVIDKRKHK